MKKLFKVLFFAFVGVFAITLSSCRVKESEHQPQAGWYRDASSHWHKCGHCDEQLDLAVHNYDIWVLTQGKCEETRRCKTCGFIQKRNVEHTWGEWGLDQDGLTCKVCDRCNAAEYLTQYYVRGSFDEGWAALDDYKLVIDASTMTASVTVNLTKGTEFKVADSGWSKQFNATSIIAEEGLLGGTDNIVVLATGTYTFTVSGLDGEHKCTVTAVLKEPTPVVETYIVAFNINGHGAAQNSVSGVTALPAELPVLTAEGYRFDGWYTDEALTTAAVAGATISSNTVLYAKWTELYNVVYNNNGHGEAQAEVKDVLALPAELPVLTKEG